MNLRNDELLPLRVDEIASTDPDRVYAEISVSHSSYDEGFRPVTYSQLANAVNGTAWWLSSTLGQSNNFECIAYCGPNDLRYPIFVLGAAKAGYKTFIFSPRNSVKAQERLFEELECKTLVVSAPEPHCVEAITKSISLQKLNIASLEELLHSPQRTFPYGKTYSIAKDEPLAVIHTSGSTGFPKPLIIPHSFFTCYANCQQAPAPEGFVQQNEIYPGRRLMSILPMFHAAGLYSCLATTILSGIIYIPLKPEGLPSAEGIGAALKHTEIDGLSLGPSQIEEIAKNQNLLQWISSKVDSIYFAGGSVPQSLGDIVAGKLRFFSILGSSEMGQYVHIKRNPTEPEHDWSYFRWDEARTGMQFRERAENLYELVVVRNSEKKDFQSVFTIFPHLSEFSTKDLFMRHPTVPGLWKYAGRADDVIVFLNGEKTNPTSMEKQIASHPKVKSALVVGEKRFQAALLVELTGITPQDTQSRSKIIQELWPTIEMANAECPAHARIAEDLIFFTKPDKPMVRAGKGTVVRRATMQLYSKETDRLHNDVDDTRSSAGGALIEDVFSFVKDEKAFLTLLHQSVAKITGRSDLGYNEDFFTSGMDSLHAIQLLRLLRANLGTNSVNLNAIYLHSSVGSLAKYLQGTLSKSQLDEKLDERNRQTNVRKAIETRKAILDTFTKPTGVSETKLREQKTIGRTVLLTGSTGFIGSFILQSLAKSSDIAHVYCLNRPSKRNGTENAASETNFPADSMERGKVTFLVGELARPGFGLGERELQCLMSSIDLIIHAAWAVDFNRALSAFEDQLDGVVELVRFSWLASSTPTMFFLSSISSVQRSRDVVLETLATDPSLPAHTGYGESKFAAEQLLAYSVQTLGQDVTLLRAGQIAGPVHGTKKWKRHEWLPSMLISSAYLGAVPASLSQGEENEARKSIDWIPVDYFAEIAVELALRRSASPEHSEVPRDYKALRVFHAVHPRPVSWADILPTIVSSLELVSQQGSIAVVSFHEWLDRLHTSGVQMQADESLEGFLAHNPGIKLLDFYRDMVHRSQSLKLDTRVAESASATMRSMEPLQPAWMRQWILGWFQ